ncbi:pilus assembly protein TadG-related protein [Streptomyces erythrochromogenes]|uniref:pilus assembly protein TadG-related protein n=1 Tax=Streptomyces erythrochromogenes TaxID=285574 RepID=UPI0036B20675
MDTPGSRDRGQAFPIYVIVLTGLLFAAFAFVVVGMAGATRSEAQGAADAAALAAAREARDNAFEGTDLLALTAEEWEELIGGDRLNAQRACAKASAFAAMNGADATCEVAIPEVKVSVTTHDAIGKTVIPGTEDVRGHASAKAVIEPRCSLRSEPAPQPTPSATSTSPPSPGGGDGGTPPSISIQCKGDVALEIDLKDPGSLTQLARKLFSVRLTD